METGYDRQQGTEKHISKSSIALFILLLVITLACALAVYAKSMDPDLNVLNLKEVLNSLASGGRGLEIKDGVREIVYDSREHTVIGISRGDIIKCAANSVTWYDKSGKEKKTVQIQANKPIIRTAGEYTLVADLNGREMYLFRGLTQVWSKRLENNLINADVSEDGFVTAVQEIKGYKAKVDVFDPQLDEPLLLTRTIAECFVIGARVLPSGRQLFLNKVDASGVSADARLEFSEMFETKPFADIRIKNTILPSVYCFSDDSILAAGDRTVVYLDKNKNIIWNREYEAGQVYGVAESDGRYAVIAAYERSDSGKGRVTVRIIRLKDGEETDSFSVPGNIQRLSVSGNTIGICSGREARFYNLKGRQLGVYRPRADITDLRLLNGREALVLTKAGIMIVDIK